MQSSGSGYPLRKRLSHELLRFYPGVEPPGDRRQKYLIQGNGRCAPEKVNVYVHLDRNTLNETFVSTSLYKASTSVHYHKRVCYDINDRLRERRHGTVRVCKVYCSQPLDKGALSDWLERATFSALAS